MYTDWTWLRHLSPVYIVQLFRVWLMLIAVYELYMELNNFLEKLKSHWNLISLVNESVHYKRVCHYSWCRMKVIIWRSRCWWIINLSITAWLERNLIPNVKACHDPIDKTIDGVIIFQALWFWYNKVYMVNIDYFNDDVWTCSFYIILPVSLVR